MNKSESINELATALSKAQGQMGGAKKDSDNPFFKSKYADLASVVEAIRGPLAEQGLSYVQLPVVTEREEVQIETALLHSSGQWISSVVTVPVAKLDAHGYGSALTYARRYGLQSMVGVPAMDDDGNAAVSAKPRATEAEMTPSTVPGPRFPPETATHPRLHKFVISKSNYATAGMTQAQMVASFDLVRQVNEIRGKGTAEAMLKTEFGVVSRSDLDEERAERYLVRLTELRGDA
jgi:hypothetical protein